MNKVIAGYLFNGVSKAGPLEVCIKIELYFGKVITNTDKTIYLCQTCLRYPQKCSDPEISTKILIQSLQILICLRYEF